MPFVLMVISRAAGLFEFEKKRVELAPRFRSLCECDKLFGQQLEEAYKSWSAELHVFLNDWNPYDECVRPPSSGALECCWNGESPFLTFNGETHVCCGDGSTATNLADCPAPTTPQPGPAPGGYGRWLELGQYVHTNCFKATVTTIQSNNSI